MAADVGGGDGGGKGKKGRKPKARPRIDMTPMVDLGFLLLTFFVLTTTMATPTVMPVVVPAEKEEEEKQDPEDKVAEGKVLFLLLSGKNRVYYYQQKKEGDVNLEMVDYSAKGLRRTIKKYQEEVRAKYRTPDDPNPLIVMIKMTDDANYQNYVDAIDEMNITEQGKYMLLDITRTEAEMIRDYEANQNLPLSVEKTLESLGGSTQGNPNQG